MHVIVLTTSKSASGGTRQALYLAEGLSRLGHTVHFVCPPGKRTGEMIRDMQLCHIPLPANIRDANKTLRSLMPENEPTIVHAFHNQGVKLIAYLGTYWRALGLQVACVAHRGVTSRPINPLPYLLPGIRAYLVNSKACADTLPLLWRKGRCHVVNNSIPESRTIPSRSSQDMRMELGIPEDVRIIGNVSNDNPLKGAGRVIEAFALARRELPPSKLVLVGVTPEKWQPLCNELGIAEDVKLIPKTDTVANYFQLMDVLVFPSSFIESQPNVIIEAMVMGLPVIAGDVGGISELLPWKCLFDPNNINEISEMLKRVLWDADMLKRLGEANSAQKRRFSQEYRLQLIMKYYQQVLTERSAQSF